MPIEIAALLVAMLPRLRRYARVLTRADAAADDLVQSACERALAAERGPVDGAPFDAWMLRIVRNIWVDQARRDCTEGATVALDDPAAEPAWAERVGPDTAEITDRRLALARVRVAIDQLPEDHREVLLLVCGEGLSYRDAAAMLEVPIGTVMSRLARARARLAALSDPPARVSGAAARGISGGGPRLRDDRSPVPEPSPIPGATTTKDPG
jgi:RNA polymerase sigma-70 factor (ECF subfamily)